MALDELSTGRTSHGDGGGDEAAAVLEAPWVGVGAFQYFSVAIMIMFIMFASHSAMTYSAEDRTTGAYLRIRAIGISRSTYLVAGVASAALVGFVFALVMAVITRVLFRVEWGDPVAWTLMTIGGAMSIAALSFLIMAVLPNNPKSVESAGGTVYTILSFLGGSTVPLTIMPDVVCQDLFVATQQAVARRVLGDRSRADVANLAAEFPRTRGSDARFVCAFLAGHRSLKRRGLKPCPHFDAWVSISAHSTLRAYISPANLMWLVAIPIILSLVISLWMGGESGAQWADGRIASRPLGEIGRAENSHGWDGLWHLPRSLLFRSDHPRRGHPRRA